MKIHLPAFGPDLPVHSFTGLTALGMRRNGAPIWPVKGGSQPLGADDDTGGGDDSSDDSPLDGDTDQLGDAGKKALDSMKADRNKARSEARRLKERLAAFEKAEAERADADKSADERRAAAEKRAEQAELKALRIEVAHEKGLSVAQAKRLVGASREELEADADELLEAFPARKEQDKQTKQPKPDPSQGSRGGKALSGRDAALAEAQRRFGKTPAAT